MIHETVIVTRGRDGRYNISPIGMREEGNLAIIAPFRPSTTLDNLQATRQAVINMTDDVAIIAGCLTGRRDWPLTPVGFVNGARLAAALAHLEVAVERIEDDELRPRFFCKILHRGIHCAFRGFNRAQAAVLEAAILVSRLQLLPPERVAHDLEYLSIAIEKTAGPRERLAWQWLMEKITAHRQLAAISA